MALRVVFLKARWGQGATEGEMTPPDPFPKPGFSLPESHHLEEGALCHQSIFPLLQFLPTLEMH